MDKPVAKINQQPEQMIDKQLISQRFGSSAASYDRGAALQRHVGNRLLTLLPERCQRLIDLGTGPGYFTSALDDRCGQLVGLDISPEMLKFARKRHHNESVMWVSGDAEQLPLATESVDAIYSSLMLQWVHQLSTALQEAARVLQPGGTLAFSTLLDGTLFELATAWQQVDDQRHINEFLTQSQLINAIDLSGLTLSHIEIKPHHLYYDDVLGLMRDLKAIGANQTSSKKRGLMGRATLKKLATGYAPFKTPNGLTATYQVAYCVLTKVK